MKLRNKKTGEIKEFGGDRFELFEYYNEHGDGIKKVYSYNTLAELNEEWEDYKPKRFRLVKDLPTFKAGEMFELEEDGSLFRIDHTGCGAGRVMAYHKQTLEKFPNVLEDWFEPIADESKKAIDTDKVNELIDKIHPEPLIRDEKIRKAVRVWADANGCSEGIYFTNFEADNTCYFLNDAYDDTQIWFDKCLPDIKSGEAYTITELCGEEECER